RRPPRSAWAPSGGKSSSTTRGPRFRKAHRKMSAMSIDAIADRVSAGERIGPDEGRRLYTGAPTAVLGRLAHAIRQRKHPEGLVTYIIDRNVNYTNVCVARCKFCAFYREVGSSEGYTLGFDE